MVQHALCLATIFGPFLVLTGLWALLYHANAVKVWNSMKATPACFYLAGSISLLIGFVMLSLYNVWAFDLSFLVTLLGWYWVLRGILGLFLPQFLLKAFGHGKLTKVFGLIPFIWGIALCWYAFS